MINLIDLSSNNIASNVLFLATGLLETFCYFMIILRVIDSIIINIDVLLHISDIVVTFWSYDQPKSLHFHQHH